MAPLLGWQDSDQHDAIERALQAMNQGLLVCFPTETLYVLASALTAEGVSRLTACGFALAQLDLALALASGSEALDLVPNMSRIGRRLTRRCWPGPVTLVFDSAGSRLPDSLRNQLCPAGTLSLQVPAHDAIWNVLRVIGPLAVRAIPTREGHTPPEALADALGDTVALVIADGPNAPELPTVVRVSDESWSVTRPGIVPEADIRAQTACLVVFVCTGNTCRSPMAEALCRKLLAARMGCRLEELQARGFVVVSAGLAAMHGDGAAPEAVAAVRELGGDIPEHRSQPLTPELAEQADYLIAMTHGHLMGMSRFCGMAVTPRLLSGDDSDVADPIGGGPEVYRDCAREILHHLERLVPEFDP